MNEATWEITEMPSGTWYVEEAWYVEEEGALRAHNETLVCGGLTKEQAMYRAAASGRVFTSGIGELQRWEVPK